MHSLGSTKRAHTRGGVCAAVRVEGGAGHGERCSSAIIPFASLHTNNLLFNANQARLPLAMTAFEQKSALVTDARNKFCHY